MKDWERYEHQGTIKTKWGCEVTPHASIRSTVFPDRPLEERMQCHVIEEDQTYVILHNFEHSGNHSCDGSPEPRMVSSRLFNASSRIFPALLELLKELECPSMVHYRMLDKIGAERKAQE